jgi:uncharacterized protein (TIGR02246 family)
MTTRTNRPGRRVSGRAEFEAAMRAALASPLADVTTTVEVDDVRLLRPDVALVSATKRVTDARSEAADEVPTTGAMTYVVVDEGQGWRIASAQTTPVRA